MCRCCLQSKVQIYLHLFLIRFYNPAGDFFTGVSRRLGGEIVRLKVNDDDMAHDFFDREACCKKGHIGNAVI